MKRLIVQEGRKSHQSSRNITTFYLQTLQNHAYGRSHPNGKLGLAAVLRILLHQGNRHTGLWECDTVLVVCCTSWILPQAVQVFLQLLYLAYNLCSKPLLKPEKLTPSNLYQSMKFQTQKKK